MPQETQSQQMLLHGHLQMIRPLQLSGGLNGLNFDSNTLSIDAAGDK